MLELFAGGILIGCQFFISSTKSFWKWFQQYRFTVSFLL